MEDEEDLVIAFRNMMTKKNSVMVSRISELEDKVAALTKDRSSLMEDNATMADMIAELESKLTNDNEISLLGDINTSECTGSDDDKEEEDGGGGCGGGNGGGGDDTKSPVPLLSIPEDKAKYLLKRIEDGKRITIYNCMYIGLYSKDNRYRKAVVFRKRVVSAYHTMCIRYADEMNIPSDKHNIPNDFAVVKSQLNDLATLDEREFIRNMFVMIDNNL
jgi:hypothetical protein